MFTGIIENMAQVIEIKQTQGNISLILKSSLTDDLKIDQSVAHNGCCLTVESIDAASLTYQVTAIHETLKKTTLGSWRIGDNINLERSMQHNGRLDGHIVQGHVDAVGLCIGRADEDGSWKFTFRYVGDQLTVEKGSITVNGVSLTVVDGKPNEFSVCIIPYTFNHTTFHSLNVGDQVNLEFDIIGKYVHQYMKAYENR